MFQRLMHQKCPLRDKVNFIWNTFLFYSILFSTRITFYSISSRRYSRGSFKWIYILYTSLIFISGSLLWIENEMKRYFVKIVSFLEQQTYSGSFLIAYYGKVIFYSRCVSPGRKVNGEISELNNVTINYTRVGCEISPSLFDSRTIYYCRAYYVCI